MIISFCISADMLKLLAKLESCGMSGQLLEWIKSSGIVQGTVIGLLIFVLYINDTAFLINDHWHNCKLFADDLKLYLVIEADADVLNDVC